MDSFYSQQELPSLGIDYGERVKISRGVRFYGKALIGDDSRIDDGCILLGTVITGKCVHLAPYGLYYGAAGIEIGDFSGFGPFSVLHTDSDDYSGNSMFGPCVPDYCRPLRRLAPIVVGRLVIGGTRVTILPGVRIAQNCAIGAHSLVKLDCQQDGIYAGTPTRRIGERSKEIYNIARAYAG